MPSVSSYCGGKVGPLGLQPILAVLDAQGLGCADLGRVCGVGRGAAGSWARGHRKPVNRAHVEMIRAYLSERLGVELRHDQLWTWPPPDATPPPEGGGASTGLDTQDVRLTGKKGGRREQR